MPAGPAARRSFMPACCGVRSAFPLLQSMHASTQFSHDETPPCDRGKRGRSSALRRPAASAVLARPVVALEDVVAAEADRAFGCRLYSASTITSGTRSRVRTAWMKPRPPPAQARPVGPRVDLVTGRVDHACRLVPQQHQRPRHRGHVHRLPVAIEDQRRACRTLAIIRSLLSRYERLVPAAGAVGVMARHFNAKCTVAPFQQGCLSGVEPPPSGSQPDVQKPLHHRHHRPHRRLSASGREKRHQCSDQDFEPGTPC